jgi:predicted alpha/beta-fold hydrolase
VADELARPPRPVRAPPRRPRPARSPRRARLARLRRPGRREAPLQPRQGPRKVSQLDRARQLVLPDTLAREASPSHSQTRASSDGRTNGQGLTRLGHGNSGHLATIACTIFSFRYDPIEYTRELIRVPDGGTIAVDITPPVAPNEKLDNTPLLVVSHGLTGGSHESYVRNVLAIVTRPVAQGGLGWRAAVVNSRGCAGAPITSPKLYSGEVTDDLRCALAFLSHFAPDAPLYGIGFSLGANQQAKFVGEEGPDCPYNGAVVLGAPFDFVKGHIALSSSWLRGIYSRAMAANLK